MKGISAMPLSLMLLIILSLFGGYFLISKNIFVKSENVKGEQVSPTNIPTPASTDVSNPNINNVDQQIGILPPSPKPTPSPTAKPKDSQVILSEFYYPNASQISGDNKSLNLQSGDNPDSITNWYKDKIRSLGMNAKSFVTTKTNDNVLNKLAGAGGGKEIKVEISKKSNETLTKISVNTN